MTTLDDASLFAADRRVLENPFPFYEAARAIGPIVQEPYHGVFLVTSHEDILEISMRHEDFSAAVTAYGPWASDLVPSRPTGCPFGHADLTDELAAWRAETSFGFIPVVSFDPPRHTDFRSLVNRLFTPARQRDIAPNLQQLAKELVDEFIEAGQVEFVSSFATPYPFFVINEVFGIPAEDRAAMRALYRSRSTPASPADPAQSLQAMRGVIRGEVALPAGAPARSDLDERFIMYLRERRERPRDDILSEIANARFADGTLPALDELVDVSTVVYGAGHNTTSHFLASAMQILASDPTLQAQLRGDPTRIQSFVDEALRFAPPVQGLFRYAKRDVEIDGVAIPAGSIIWLLYAAANRDPECFDDPQQFDPTRFNARQAITFGHGIHFCPGQPLARLEARLAFTELLHRMDEIRIEDGASDTQWPFWFILRGPDTLHLRFDAR